ncbi:MAG: hypothetical protein AW10_02971 [Candidatus Accumulibacter appositus]|uniref:Uncharacterized protein n=1 Tax=Candidatus Accumulibacter appositus TaxID=1454003 RepID=A0A011QIF2_9PROT|nr:MAG: hypothetical protein AW10_02971 [Candidatus Accumulibacter appositus]
MPPVFARMANELAIASCGSMRAGRPTSRRAYSPTPDLGKALRSTRRNTRFGLVTLAILLSGCASNAPQPHAREASDSISPQLACTLSSNCANSLGSGGLLPLFSKQASNPASFAEWT